VKVRDWETGVAAANAQVALYRPGQARTARTDHNGVCMFYGVAPGQHWLHYGHPNPGSKGDVEVIVDQDGITEATIDLFLAPKVILTYEMPDGGEIGRRPARVNDVAVARIEVSGQGVPEEWLRLEADPGWSPVRGDAFAFAKTVRRAGREECKFRLFSRPLDNGPVNPGPEHDSALGGAAPPAPGAGFDGEALMSLVGVVNVEEAVASPVTGELSVSMRRTETSPTDATALDRLIRRSTEALSFSNYLDFTNALFGCSRWGALDGKGASMGAQLGEVLRASQVWADGSWRGLSFVESDAYRVLRAATEAFVMVNCAVFPGKLHREHNLPFGFDAAEDQAYLERRDLPGFPNLNDAVAKYLVSDDAGTRMLPYLAIIRRKLPDVPVEMDARGREADLCYGIVQQKLCCPCMIELIWNYWHEEAMLVQTMNVLTQRFQNQRAPGSHDPLANLAIDPLRPLNNLIWSYIQDEQHRLTVLRRSFEYNHEYGLQLEGKAVRDFRPADARSRFLEAFHVLLRLCTVFYRQDDDTNVKADAFPVLNALKEVHLILSQGAHNQFGGLPTAARIEMLMQQWILARPEFREYLPTRVMVAYPEPWMDRVDAMKKLQGWDDTSVIHFHNLARFGEQLLLSIRYGNWSVLDEPTEAFNWARLWRPQIQGYVHAYRAVTGHDLTGEARDPAADGTLPSVLLRRRMAQQLGRQAQPQLGRQAAPQLGAPQAQQLPVGQQLPAPERSRLL
jgi:hypothetical protein